MPTEVDKLSAEMAFKANVDAASRDYICEPHLGERCSSAARGPSACQRLCRAPGRP